VVDHNSVENEVTKSITIMNADDSEEENETLEDSPCWKMVEEERGCETVRIYRNSP